MKLILSSIDLEGWSSTPGDKYLPDVSAGQPPLEVEPAVEFEIVVGEAEEGAGAVGSVAKVEGDGLVEERRP